MSKSHDKNLPIISRHVSTIWSSTHIEAQLDRRGEKMDVFARAERDVKLTMPDMDIELPAGATSVHEYKDSVADLRVDRDKPWRQTRDWKGHFVRAFGEHRFYWIRRDGDVRPEHVDEDQSWGWGVVLFDEVGFEIVKASVSFSKRCAFRETIQLVDQLRLKSEGLKLTQLMNSTVPANALANRTRNTPDAEQSGSGGGATIGAGPVPTGRVDPVQVAYEYLSVAKAPLSLVTKHLLHEYGIKITETKLKAMMLRSGRFQRPRFAGEGWDIRDRGAA